MTSLLEAQNVTRIFGGGLLRKGHTVAVDGVSLIINEDKPSITTIAGESGSGKTTLARLLLGLIQPTHGSILYRGHSLTAMDGRVRKTFRREVQAIFQDPYEAYNPVYKIDQTLETPVRKFRLGHSREESRQRIEDSLRMAGLRPEETLGRYPHQLSGGHASASWSPERSCSTRASSWPTSRCRWSTRRCARPFSKVWSS